MDYSYEDALERAKKLLNGAKVFDYDNEQTAHDIRTTVCNIFPELKESEDERIVKCLLNYFHHVRYNGLDLKGTDVDEVIAWLEKQGKQKPTWSKEDEKMLSAAVGATSAADYYTYDDKCKIESWLKSLKQRIGE